MSGLPEGMANGHCRGGQLDKEDRIWERPWTLEEMRQNGANWSLAADSGLFLFLQEFSQKMLSKTHEIEKQLDSLIRDTKATDSCLHSVFNDFLMLSNTQFIENRVYDEEVEETAPKAEASEKPPEQEKTREQKEAELIPKMQEAVNYGLGVLESAFEHLDIKAGNSDSEDEEVMDRVEPILEPKDLYVDRPLPYLIGSQAFMEHEDVGLGDLSSDEMSVDSDRDSVMESDNGKDTDQSDEDYDQEEDEPMHIKKKSSMMSYEDAEEDDEDSDIFGDSDKEEDDDDAKTTGPSSFADELAARIKGEPINKPEGDRASLSSKKKSKGRKERKSTNPQGMEDDSDDMFKPPKMDEDEFSPFGGKGGLFSGGRGLFSDDDEGDLFSEAPKPLESKEKKAPEESGKATSQATETKKTGKKIPAGAVSIFPENSLFSSGNESNTGEGKENETPALKTNVSQKEVLLGAGNGGGAGLFDDDDEDDDFFNGKNLKRSNSEHEKPKPRKTIDLFDDDEDGDIFGDRAQTPIPNQTETVAEPVKPAEKKMPAGAISLFGPGTKSLLSEGLKKRQQSTSEESGKSEERNSSTSNVGPVVYKQNQKAEARGLFSDDEDSQGLPPIVKSQSNPESTSKRKTNKTPLSLFDDEEEEDLFGFAAKTKATPSQSKAPTQQTINATSSSSLFSDDEDSWINTKSSSNKTETDSGGMKSSVSAPTSLLSTKVTPKSSLFDVKDDDLFAPSNASSQMKPHKVALLFEDEDDEDKGSLFGTIPANNTSTVAPDKTPDVSTPAKESSHPTSKKKLSEPEIPPLRTPENVPPSHSADGIESKKKPTGAVSLFGGIDVLANKLTKSPQEEVGEDDIILSKDSSPKSLKKEKKLKTTSVSLFDEDADAESDPNPQIFPPSKPATEKTLKPTEDWPQAKSTGVFQDEELLFSQTQQKDNDPDVDLFAPSGKAASSKPKLVKPAAQSLFSDEDEDDLFGSVEQKVPPLVKAPIKPSKPTGKAPLASPDPISENQKPPSDPVKPKDPSSRIGKLQASLMINTAALLPGAAASLPGAVGVLSGMGPSSSSGVSSSSLSPSPVTSPVAAQPDSEGAVSFDVPVEVSTLQSAQKRRAKGSVHRRPQSRAARQQSAQTSMEDKEETPGGDNPGPNSSLSNVAPSQKSNISSVSPPLANLAGPTALSTSSNLRPSDLTLPVLTNAGKTEGRAMPSSDENDLFASDGLFGATTVPNTPTPEQTTKKPHTQASSMAGLKKENGKSTLSSIFDDDTDDLFQKVKPRPSTKTPKVSNTLDKKDDDDIFGLNNSSTPTPTSAKEAQSISSFSKHDIFQDEVATVPKVLKKHKENPLHASMFSDNIDIFADLSDTLKPKQKSKTKAETKSIFDDDMDDIFSPSTVKAVAAAPRKSKKSPPAQEAAKTAEPSNIFDDPLNALGGN